MTSPVASAAPAVDIASLAQHIGEIVTLRGWVYHLRSSGKVRFLVLRDGSGLARECWSKATSRRMIFSNSSGLPWNLP